MVTAAIREGRRSASHKWSFWSVRGQERGAGRPSRLTDDRSLSSRAGGWGALRVKGSTSPPTLAVGGLSA